MFPNVKAEMARRDITIGTLSEKTGIRYQTLADKLRGDSPLSWNEAKKIKESLETDLSLEVLFEEVP